jgi:hypothetical protein
MSISRPTRATTAAALVTAAVAAAPTMAATEEERGGFVLRRDGSKAVEVVTLPEPAARADGFNWGDAGLGAGAGVAALLVVATGAYGVRGRRAARRSPLPAHQS